MWSTSWKDSADTDIYEGDVVRDLDACIGAVVWWREECCFAIQYPKESREPEMLSMAEFSPENLTYLGNIYEHPDWGNWWMQ
jgi:hypothetical protein